MELWHPRAELVIPANTQAGGYRVDCPWKFVLHTVEGESYSPSEQSYYGHQSYPHFTVGERLWQHFPIDAAARALYNAAGGVETNAARAIQAEIVWWAGRIADLPDVVLANLADLTGWLIGQGVIPLFFAEFRGDGSYGEDALQRFGADEWYGFAGICGHQHVPENDHWDPGDFPVDRLRTALGQTPEEDDMFEDGDKQRLARIEEKVNGNEVRWEELKRGLGRAAGGDGSNWHQFGDQLDARLDRLECQQTGAGGSIDVDALAEKVADKLAERLKD